ncbi:MAG: Rrf2 family transcriptional regulator [Gemmatimonadetes bacterium]|nr:Rrf2 family transcriptional regulator [Gemmatimonadota bacterium]
MISQTTQMAIRVLLYVALRDDDQPVAVQEVAGSIEGSPSYAAKVVGQLVKSGMLSSQRGKGGGVKLARSPADISLLHVVRAFQGDITRIGNGNGNGIGIGEMSLEEGGYHLIMEELRMSIISILSRWTLADLVRKSLLSLEPERNGVERGVQRGQVAG